jgi:hypothetical protein
VSRQDAVNQRSDNARSVGGQRAGVAGVAAANRTSRAQTPVQTSSTVRRVRKPKRKWHRPTQYFRDYSSGERIYYRPGVR